MKLVLCDWGDVPKVWPEVEGWIGEALEMSVCYKPSDILACLMTGAMNLWLAVGDKIEACAVTQVVKYPRANLCLFIVVGGRGIDDWIHFESGIAKWAKERNCGFIEGFGRRGWERKMKEDGYIRAFTVYRKALA